MIQDESPNDWADDVSDLSPRPLAVRCEVVARETGSGRIPLSNDDLDWYREAFARYRAELHVPMPVLTLRTIAPVGWNVPSSEWYLHAPLNASFSNQFIDYFSDEARRIMLRFTPGPLTARHVIIWNEPNGEQGGFISAEHFAAILYHCRQKLNQISPRPQMYWGGVLFAGEPGHPDTVDTVPKLFVEGIYQKLVDNGKAGPTGPWPWEGVNVHIHRERTSTYVERFFGFLDGEVRDNRQDNGLIVIGEWGITVQDYTQRGHRIATMYNRLKPHVDQMIYFSHHVHEEDVGSWGTREYYESSPPDPNDPGAFLLDGGPGKPPTKTVLWQDLKNALASP